MKKFDLTTLVGINLANNYVQGIIYDPKTPETMIPSFYELLKLLLGGLFGNKEQKEQSEAIEKLIEAGKREGVDEMEVTIRTTKGLKLNIPEAEEIKVDTTLGSDEKIKLRIRYK